MSDAPVIVVGGGLAGLGAAAMLGRAGRDVVLYEKASSLGGRASTQRRDGGFLLNQGPHALFVGGAGMRELRKLGLEPRGKTPSASGGYAVAGGVKHTLPGGLVSLLTTGLLRLPAKLETARLLASLGRLETSSLQTTTVRAWTTRALRHPEVRQLVEALLRLSTYANAPDAMSAGVALRQLQIALADNVLYLDGGWQTLVDGLRAVAEQAGVRIVGGARVVAVDSDAAGVRGVRLADGTAEVASAVILATDPAGASALAGPAARGLAAFASTAVPVRAACLDLCLTRLPRERATFALGIDEPLYLSVHSARAALAPEGAALIQLARYLECDGRESDPAADERALDGLMDLVQPGWRDVVVDRRFLPKMVVTHAMPSAAMGGLAGRPAPSVPEISGLHVAGDWVGGEGMLADASFASAAQAVQAIVGTPVSASGRAGVRAA